MGATTIVAIHVSRVSPAGSFERIQSAQAAGVVRNKKAPKGVHMPRGRSTFTKRQKEQTRQQRQKDKAERRSQRKQEDIVAGRVDEMDVLRQHAAEQQRFSTSGPSNPTTPSSRPQAITSANDWSLQACKQGLLTQAHTRQ